MSPLLQFHGMRTVFLPIRAPLAFPYCIPCSNSGVEGVENAARKEAERGKEVSFPPRKSRNHELVNSPPLCAIVRLFCCVPLVDMGARLIAYSPILAYILGTR